MQVTAIHAEELGFVYKPNRAPGTRLVILRLTREGPPKEPLAMHPVDWALVNAHERLDAELRAELTAYVAAVEADIAAREVSHFDASTGARVRETTAREVAHAAMAWLVQNAWLGGLLRRHGPRDGAVAGGARVDL